MTGDHGRHEDVPPAGTAYIRPAGTAGGTERREIQTSHRLLDGGTALPWGAIDGATDIGTRLVDTLTTAAAGIAHVEAFTPYGVIYRPGADRSWDDATGAVLAAFGKAAGRDFVVKFHPLLQATRATEETLRKVLAAARIPGPETCETSVNGDTVAFAAGVLSSSRYARLCTALAAHGLAITGETGTVALTRIIITGPAHTGPGGSGG